MNIEAIALGIGANLGGLWMTAFIFPVMYWWQARRQPERQLSWGVLIGIFLISTLASGLVYSALVRFQVPADKAYEASVPALFGAVAVTQALLLIAWQLKRTTPTFPVRLFVVFLVAWLVFGGGYLSIIMVARAPIRDPFWIVAAAPLLIVIAYLVFSATAKWLLGSTSNTKE